MSDVRYRPAVSFILLLVIVGWLAGCAGAPDASIQDRLTDEPFERLCKGNERFARNACVHPHGDASRRSETAEDGQHPMATIVACSDSRVPVELLFDMGIGDLFVIRVAGNVCGVDEVGSVEYAVDHLQTPLVVVLGHERCGAVTAACQHAHEPGSTSALLDRIATAVRISENSANPRTEEERVALAVRENVRHSLVDLMQSESIARAVIDRRTTIAGGVYDIASGRVEWTKLPMTPAATSQHAAPHDQSTAH